MSPWHNEISSHGIRASSTAEDLVITLKKKGVSTKHLSTHLDWFRWCRTFMATDSRTAESTVTRQLANGNCSTRIGGMFNVLPPYMDCWVTRAA